MIRALLLALVALLSLPAHAERVCTAHATRCEYPQGSETWAAVLQRIYAEPNNCGADFFNGPNGTCARPFFWVGDDPEPTACPSAGTEYPTLPLSIDIANLGSPSPSQACEPRNGTGCVVEPAGWNAAVKTCNTAGKCQVSYNGGTRYTGATCVPSGDGNSPFPPEEPVDPEDPEPIDPEDPPPGCKNLTDPDCGPIEETPPGCTKTTKVTATGGVEETTVCKKTVCGPSRCKTTSTSVTNYWGSTAAYKNKQPPDQEGEKKTEETEEPRCNGGSCTGNGGGGNTGGGGTGGGGTGGGGTGGGGGGSYCAKNPTDPMCPGNGDCEGKGMSKRLACMEAGTAENTQIPKANIDLTVKAPLNFGSSGGGCPAPTSISVGGHSVTIIDPSAVCGTLSSVVKPIVMLLAAFAAAMIIFKGTEV